MALRRSLPVALASPGRGLAAKTAVMQLACAMIREYPELLRPRLPTCDSDEEAMCTQDGSRDDDLGDRAGARSQKLPADSASGLLREAPGQEQRSRQALEVLPSPSEVPLDDPVLSLLQHVCVMLPDRAELRASGAEALLQVLREAAAVEALAQGPLEHPPLVARFLDFVLRLQRCDRPSCRGFAVELLAALVATEEGSDSLLSIVVAMNCYSPQTEMLADHTSSLESLLDFLFNALIERCSDALPTVRARALAGVGTMSRCVAKKMPELLRRLFLSVASTQCAEESDECREQSSLWIIPAGLRDEKGMVRRAALALLDIIVPLLQSPLGLSAEEVFSLLEPRRLLCAACVDESMSVRRAAIGSLAALLRSCPTRDCCSLWSSQVLPLLMDDEASVADRAFEELDQALLRPLARAAKAAPGQVARQLPAVIDAVDAELTNCLGQGHLANAMKKHQSKLPNSLTEVLAAVAASCCNECQPSEWPLTVWAMLEEAVSLDPSAVPWSLPFDAWHALAGPGAMEKLKQIVIGVLQHSIAKVPAARRQVLARECLADLARLATPTSQVPAMLRMLDRVLGGEAGSEKGWKSELLARVTAELERAQREPSTEPGSELCAALFLLGELAVLDDTIVSEAITSLVQAAAVKRTSVCCDAVQGHAFIALGKLCLKSEALAKRKIEIFVLHLDASQPFVVRNNVLLVFAELCARYTSLAERFLSRVTDLFRDQNELLRKQAVMLLASLVSENYVRFRGDVLHRFVFVLSDSTRDVRQAMESIFVRVLLPRHRELFQQHLVDLIFSLNGLPAPGGECSAGAASGFSLAAWPARRAMTYDFMLSQMTPEQKVHAAFQLVNSLLGTFASPEGPALQGPDGGPGALGDGLQILLACSAELRGRLSGPRTACQEEEQCPDELSLPGHFQRKLCEEACPVLIQLKSRMEAVRSPLQDLLRKTLLELLREWRSESEEELAQLLGGDAQLAREIAFDLREEKMQSRSQTSAKLLWDREGREDDRGEDERQPASPASWGRSCRHIATPQKRPDMLAMLKRPATCAFKTAEVEDSSDLSRRGGLKRPASCEFMGLGLMEAARLMGSRRQKG
eukprot:TRINITY_DN57439_c0_g1_i1.p1 TRINITY_DN57439_c0_g1~~TRINITY_DN57439_c0_g1_i1.p1  ORF type:complete len:1216 (-),score=250.44 TRINITY_DN57439_c0_g1_i1:19-3291(-)